MYIFKIIDKYSFISSDYDSQRSLRMILMLSILLPRRDLIRENGLFPCKHIEYHMGEEEYKNEQFI